jgi:hypothetical protein
VKELELPTTLALSLECPVVCLGQVALWGPSACVLCVCFLCEEGTQKH